MDEGTDILDNSRIFLFHEDRIRNYGEGTVEALGWKRKMSQTERFKVLARIGDINNKSVLDVGCGHGDLKPVLDNLYTGIQYTGIDQMKAFLDVAIKKYGELPCTTFSLGDYITGALPAADYVIASGALNYRRSDPNFIFKMISKFFACSKVAFGFNLISKLKETDGLLMTYEPNLILNYCKTLSANSVLIEGYFEDDFTIFVHR